MRFKLFHLSPRTEFTDQAELRRFLRGNILVDVPLRLFDVPRLSLVVDERYRIQLSVSQYLVEKALFSKSIAGETVRTYGEVLTEWLNHLDEVGVKLEDATEFDLQCYRNSMRQRLNRRGVPFSDSTIALRVMETVRFHSWAFNTRVQLSPLGEWASQTGMRADGMRGISKILTPQVRKLPKILNTNELSQLFRAASWPYSLMFKFALVTGLRRFELCSLKTDNLPSPQMLDRGESAIFSFDMLRKGGVRRRVYIPRRFLEDIYWYIKSERSDPQKEEFANNVFLSPTGRTIDKLVLSREYRKAADHIGSATVLHHLRHTYAVITLSLLQKRADAGESINPLKTLQILMGHSSLKSTEIYLQALDLQSDAIEEVLDFLYGATI